MKINVPEFIYSPTPEELAQEFCELYEEGQAIFLNTIGDIFNNSKYSLPMQMQYIADCKLLNNEGRHVMRLFGDYSQQGN